MIESYFHMTEAGFEPEPRSHAPWATDMLHGRLLGGVAAAALESDIGAEGWRAARLTVDLFRPAAMAPVQVETRVVREGRRVRVADAILRSDGHEVARVTAVFLPEGDDPPGRIWRPAPEPWPDPESLPPEEEVDGPDSDGWLFRTVDGGFGTAARTRVWTNETFALVDGKPISPLVRAALSGDIACPLANSGDQGLHYINADYTMLIGRQPDGDWVGIEVTQQIQSDGIAVATATLVDRLGPFATSGGTSLVRPPLEA